MDLPKEIARGCHGKIAYPSAKEANKTVKNLTKQIGSDSAHSYFCGFCGFYHVGRKMRNNR